MKTQCPFSRFLEFSPLGHLRDFQRDPYGFFEKHRPTDSTRPVALRLGFKKFYFCYHPDHAQHILQDRREAYEKSGLVLKKIKPLSGPQGLIQLQGNRAKGVRQTAAQLMGTKNLDRLVEKVQGFVEELYTEIDKSIRLNRPLDLAPHLTRIVLRTAGVFILDHDALSESDKLNTAFVTLNRRAGESLRSAVSCPFSLEQRRSLKTIHSELERVISQKQLSKGTSLLKKLQSKGESKSFICDQLKAFMFAGYDTTASSLIFAAHLVAASPDTESRIAHEASGEPAMNFNKLKSSYYLQSVYKETLRLYPSAYFLPRETVCDDELGGTLIPKGSQVFLSIRHIQRHPDFFENPDDFCGDRFLDPIKHPFSFIPFGGGPRICIGALLAKLEATVVLQKLCERYEMSPVSQSPPEIEALITAHSKSPLLVKFKRRQSHEKREELAS